MTYEIVFVHNLENDIWGIDTVSNLVFKSPLANKLGPWDTGNIIQQ